MIPFLKATLRTATAFLLALIGLALCVAIYSSIKDSMQRNEAEPYETAKDWHLDLSNSLGVKVKAKTKLVSSTIWASVAIDGYQEYFSAPANRQKSITIEFLDKDGFKVFSETINVSDLTRLLNTNGEPTGFQYQFQKTLTIDNYKRFKEMGIVTDITKETVFPKVAELPKIFADHCAPNISKKERLKRLAQNGALRETGYNSFTAGSHSITFFDSGEVLTCD